MWIVPGGKQPSSGEDGDGRRPIGELKNEALPWSRRGPLCGPAFHRLRAQNHHHQGGHLHRLVRRYAQRAILIDLAVGVKVGDVDDAGEKHERNADDAQDRCPGLPAAALGFQ